MKRIGIITIQKCDNFGADLQAYALGAKLRSMGYDAENIDYLFYKHPKHEKGVGESPVLPISVVNRIKERLFPLVNWVRRRRSWKGEPCRCDKFAAWFERNVKCGREYRSVKSLYDDPPNYDVYMVGSDQVWNPRMYSNIKPYFLDFAPKGAKCVSYASSLGVSELAGGVFYRYKLWLKRFSYIGLREKKGSDIVRSMALGVEVMHVVDPTLLLTAEEWANVSVAVEDPKVVPGKYLLLYDLIACDDTMAIAKRIAEEKGFEIVRIWDGSYGPGEFLWLFAHAGAVITNSFHGTVFSILNHRPFVTVVPRTMSNASRIESLLESVGLMSHLLRAGKSVANVSACPCPAWDEIERRLSVLRSDSIAFLRRSIEEPAKTVPHKLPIGCFAMINKDETIRAESTSGGAFTAIAGEIIRRGGIVYGAAFDADFHHVHHIAAETFEGLSPIRKSKYVWSDPSWAYKDAKERISQNRLVLFSGTPCQCAAIRKIVGESDNLITVDFVCHGTPKPEIFDEYAKGIESEAGAKLVDYQFREKKDGWNFQRIAYRFANGVNKRVIPWLDPYFRAFSLNQGLKDGCYRCPYANLERPSDITIADAWRIGASNPELDDNRGTSNVLINSMRGECVLENLAHNDMYIVRAYDLDQAQMRNHALMFPSMEMTKHLPLWYYSAVYWLKRFGWFYFKRYQ